MNPEKAILSDAKKLARKSPRWLSSLLLLSLCFALGSWVYRSNAQKLEDRSLTISRLLTERARAEQTYYDREGAMKEHYRLSEYHRQQGDQLERENLDTQGYLDALDNCVASWMRREPTPCDPSPFLQSLQTSPSPSPSTSPSPALTSISSPAPSPATKQ